MLTERHILLERMRGDATFCVRAGPVAGSVSLESVLG